METFGEGLRRAREGRRISMHDMATRTKISVGTLEALERNDVRRVPGGIFGRSFVRTYASEAGLDPDETVARFEEVLAEAEREAAERRRAREPQVPAHDRQFFERQQRAYGALRLVIVVVILAAIGLAVWALRGVWGREDAAATVPAVATVAPPAASQDVASAATTGTGADSPPPAATPSTALVVDVDFAADAWVTVTVDGRSQPSRLYRQGERTELHAAQEILLDAGNAGALRLTINGRPAKTLGADGARVSTRITPDNYSQFY